MKTYALRKQLRASMQGTVSYAVDGTWTSGQVWDLSEGGWRTTSDHPLPIGRETIVFLALWDGDVLRHFLIESAIVRWSDSRHAGWEILHVGTASHRDFADLMERGNPSTVASEDTMEPHGFACSEIPVSLV